MNRKQESSQFDKKRVAKNTIFLYFRMIVIMLVQFYTVRVTLQCLGVTDYGIYNLVGGVTNMFTFLTHTMTSASQRFFAFDIGQGNIDRLKTTVDSVFVVFLVLGILSVVLLEIVGGWLIAYKLVIPIERLFAAKVVFQVSISVLFLTILTLPFNSLIIAHEEMRTFAYVSVLDAILKLVIVFLLVNINSDKLILYSILYLCVQILISSIYILNCFRKYVECDKYLTFDISIIRKIVPFMSWNLIGGVSWMLCSQGLTIMINLFFGPVANAAKAIADKLDGSVNAFMNNFMIAAQPQIVKTYANGESDALHSLIYLSSRISFYLIMFFSIPIVFNASVLLSLWLGEVDMLTTRMVQFILLFSLVCSLENPINQSIRATGNIKNYQVYIAIITFCVLPLAYLFFKVGLPAYYGYIALIFMYGIAMIARLYFLKKQVGITYTAYFEIVLKRQMLCLIINVGFCFIISYLMKENSLFMKSLSIVLMFISSFISILFVGLTGEERLKVYSFLLKKIKQL